ncbi:uncharacterized protein YqgC (DUF456 family) [Allocatelliglobosispora scoriae]|uniref:Uncharacterized protein YqgC (DUF456 family) n=1 Tax=Allocatelliglobosispora scoriae TaxID=643052 RepID=A0A841BXU1_9ACTN|nr:DUF456 domain-containing protein [Allocatelliglobosispora scoriae]MBB5873967.1 uncharacterized protein YqgC (DUF456 family) [Allocatelliglobosispora scoriae]
MDLGDLSTTMTALAGLLIVIGVFGVIVPALPGLLFCWIGVLVWAIFTDSGWGRWAILGIATLIAIVGEVAKYLWPGRKLKQNGVPNLSLFIGGVVGIVGFFVVPVVGLILGFVLGIWLAELLRLRDGKSSWTSTKHALKAAGVSMLIELGAALAIAAVWVGGLLAT